MEASRRVRLAAVTALILAGCSGGGGGSPAPGGPGPGNPSGPSAVLSKPGDCNALRASLIEDAEQKIAVQAERLRADGWLVGQDPRTVVDVPGAPQPSEGGSPPPGDFTDTNVQVEGVDEADVVETDGVHLYVLHNIDLMVLDSWPPEATALRASVRIEGQPQAMFVADGRAAVFSWVYDDGSLDGDDACGIIGPPFPEPLIGAPIEDAPFRCVATFTKVTLIDLSVDPPSVTREIYLEGGYVGARRHGDAVRVVVQRNWGLPPGIPEPWASIWGNDPPENEEELDARIDAWQSEARTALEASSLDGWLPSHRERRDGALVDVPIDCGDVHVPPPGLSEDGATEIVSFDLRNDAAPIDETMIMGFASQIYASTDTLLLSQPEWGWFEREEETDQTALHVFALAAADTSYVASGFVPGSPLGQFSFDVRDGVIRAATTLTSREALISGTPSTTARVTTARVEGTGLTLVGSTGDLAPGERIYSARFIGDRAYVVTFRQIDPLFVIDLSDAAAPQVLGEVELPGFSEYIHPLDENHLLTIGRDVDSEGRAVGAAFRIFDISDPTAPALGHMHTLPGEGWSIAESDHHAFTFDATRGLLAVPYSRYDGPYRSTLVVLGVDADSGFSPRGEIEHEPSGSGQEPCPFAPEGGCNGPPEMRRGLFIEDWVYSVSTAGVQVHGLDDLATPVATALFPPVILP